MAGARKQNQDTPAASVLRAFPSLHADATKPLAIAARGLVNPQAFQILIWPAAHPACRRGCCTGTAAHPR